MPRLFNFLPFPWNAVAAAGVVVLGSLFIVLAFRSCDNRHAQDQANLVNQGVTSERSQSQAETINAVQNAQQVIEHPTSNQLNSVCSHYDRNCSHRS